MIDTPSLAPVCRRRMILHVSVRQLPFTLPSFRLIATPLLSRFTLVRCDAFLAPLRPLILDIFIFRLMLTMAFSSPLAILPLIFSFGYAYFAAAVSFRAIFLPSPFTCCFMLFALYAIFIALRH